MSGRYSPFAADKRGAAHVTIELLKGQLVWEIGNVHPFTADNSTVGKFRLHWRTFLNEKKYIVYF